MKELTIPSNLTTQEAQEVLNKASEDKPLADGWYERSSDSYLDILYLKGGIIYLHPDNNVDEGKPRDTKNLRPIKVEL